jgi:hypothetical protein
VTKKNTENFFRIADNKKKGHNLKLVRRKKKARYEMGGGRCYVGDAKAEVQVATTTSDQKRKRDTDIVSEVATSVANAGSDIKIESETATEIATEVPLLPSSTLPVPFVVCDYNLGYKGTALVLLVVYSAGLSVTGVSSLRFFVEASSPSEFVASLLWTMFCWGTMACVETIVANSSYLRLVQSPHQSAICVSAVLVLVALYVGALYPSAATWICVYGFVAVVAVVVAIWDLVGQHVRHLKLHELEAERARYVTDLCGRAAVAWGLKGIVCVDKFLPQSADFERLRRARHASFRIPPSLAQSLTLHLTAPLAAAASLTTAAFRIFMSDDACTTTCSISHLEPVAQCSLLAVLHRARECRIKLGLATLTVNSESAAAHQVDIAHVLRLVADSKIPKSPDTPHRSHRHLTVVANTAVTKCEVTVNDAGILQIGVHIGALTDEATIGRILREYTAYQT